MSEWQAIETAPNDVAILIYSDNGEIDFVAADDNSYTWTRYQGKERGVKIPTHWRPMPEPPK